MIQVRTEILWWRIAMACAILLLLAPTTPRTSWTYAQGGGMTHSAGSESTTHPAPLVLPFALIAAVGVVCSFVLLGRRLRIGDTA